MPLSQLITDVYNEIKDFREGQSIFEPMMSEDRIKTWVEQFDETDREFLLEELKNIFHKRYCSKTDAKQFLKAVVDKLTKDFKYRSHSEFLENTVFLNLQPKGKSQGQMLTIMAAVINEAYGFDIKDCGKAGRKNIVYIDDVLCTGNTLFQNLKTWCAEKYDDTKTNLEAVDDGTARLICTYVFIHSKNYEKKVFQIKVGIDEKFSKAFHLYNLKEVQNHDNQTSAYDLIFPLEAGISDEIAQYKDKVIATVDSYTDEGGWKKSKEEFFRPAGRPSEEKLFTSAASRERFEKIILEKGLEILSKAHAQKENIRPLGFSLKSMKDFGFGALCFTWRNVPNNTPLVFWYSGGGFNPLFTKRQV